MNTLLRSAALMLLISPFLHAAEGSPITSLKGKRYPAESRSFVAEESGLKVIQLTTSEAEDAGLYFTSNSFVPSMNSLVFTSKRSGSWNLFLMNLKTHEFIQLTDGRKISGTGADVCAATKEVFYRDGRELRAVNLETLAERSITSAPEGYNTGAAVSVTEKGDMLAFSICEIIPITTRTNVIYSDMDERFEKRPWSAVLIGRSDGTGWHEIARQKKWISHTLISPRTAGTVLYCHEGKWQRVEQRLWIATADGKTNKALRPEPTPEWRIGHEFWRDDGVHVGYQVQAPGGKKSIGIADIRDGSYAEYEAPFHDGHVQAGHHKDFFVGDGSEKEPYLNRYELKDGKLVGGHIWRHGSSFTQQHWHPHPGIAPDDSAVLLTSSRDGNGNVYLVMLNRD